MHATRNSTPLYLEFSDKHMAYNIPTELIPLELNKLWELKVYRNKQQQLTIRPANKRIKNGIILSKNSPFMNKASILRRRLRFAVNCVFIDEPITDDWELRKGIAQLLSVPNGLQRVT